MSTEMETTTATTDITEQQHQEQEEKEKEEEEEESNIQIPNKKKKVVTRKRRRALYSTPKKRKSTKSTSQSAKKSKTQELPSKPTSPNIEENQEKQQSPLQQQQEESLPEPSQKKRKTSIPEPKEEHPRSPRKHETARESNLSSDNNHGPTLGQKGKVSLLEKGRIFFCYRPKIEEDNVEDWKDVGKFYMLLEPFKSNADMKTRMIVIGNKKLPAPEHGREFNYAIVTDTEEKKTDIVADLEPTSYDTKTLGERHLSGARIAAAGLYEIAMTEKNHTHLAYAITQPDRENFGEAQSVFNINLEGEFAIQVRNPYQLKNKRSEREGLADKGKGADFPEEFRQKYFQGKTKELRWAQAMPEMLNYEKCEILLVGAHQDLDKFGEYGSDLEHESDLEREKLSKMSHPDEKVYKDLGLHHDTRPEEHPCDPLATGELA